MILLLSTLLACGGSAPADAPAAPAPLADQECAVCGMLVAEQAGPRAQAQYRGDEHRFFCSIADLRAWLEAPSALGDPRGVWVERLPPDFDPAAPAAPAIGWEPAERTACAVGFARDQGMGRPALCYADPGEAAAEAERLGGYAVTWQALRETPFNQDPPRPSAAPAPAP